MKSTDLTLLKVMNVFFWIAFIGLCIKTGAILTSFFVSIFIDPLAAKDLYRGLNLSDLQSFSMLYYVIIVSMLIILTGSKAYIAYLAVRFFLKFDLSEPFGTDMTDVFLRISEVALRASILAIIASVFCKWLMKKNEIAIPIDWSGSEILFFAGIIYLLALVFKRGTDLQNENDLTI